MSRDWRPIENVLWDERIYRQRGERLSESKWLLKGENGKPDEPLWNDEARRDYPALSFLLPGFECETYVKIAKNPAAASVYAAAEEQVAALRDAVVKQVNEGKRELSLEGIRVNETVKKWFLGELDSNFYYADENNALFREWLQEKVKEAG